MTHETGRCDTVETGRFVKTERYVETEHHVESGQYVETGQCPVSTTHHRSPPQQPN